jgi:S-adenosylmethionine hydrolase
MRPVITFLTDFGPAAPAVCRGVMFRICPDANIIDINHQVPRYSIRSGAGSLVFALPHMPVGIHVAVVDPGVGTERLPLGLRVARGDVLIGPDNGLLIGAAEALGGIVEARTLENRELMLPVITSSFHGRDIFSPVAAHLANGSTTFEALGTPIDPAELVRLATARAHVVEGTVRTEAIYVDSFGNVRLAGDRDDLLAALGPEGTPVRATIGKRSAEQARFVASFGEVSVGEMLLYVDSGGHPALADNQGNLARRTGAQRGDPVVLERT